MPSGLKSSGLFYHAFFGPSLPIFTMLELYPVGKQISYERIKGIHSLLE